MSFIEVIKKATGKKTINNDIPIHAGDVPAIFADIDNLQKQVGFQLDTNIEFALQQFIAWYKGFYNISSDDE